MDEKLRKAVKSLKTGIWVLLVITIILSAIGFIGYTQESGNTILNYLKDTALSLVQMVVLIIGLVFLGKGKHTTGAQVIQWLGMSSIIISFANVIADYLILGEWIGSILTLILPYVLIGFIIPIALIIDALKVIRLSEEQPKKVVPLISIILILCVVIFNVVIAIDARNEIEELMDLIQKPIQNETVDKEENKDDNQQAGNEAEEPKEEEPKEEEQEKEPEKEVETIDPYKNYKNMKWASTSATDSKLEATVSIEKSTAYLTYNGKKTKITGITGTPIKVLSVFAYQISNFYILTKEGKVYVTYGEETKAQLHLKDAKYVDMTYIDNHTNEFAYFLTEDGKLIDQNKVAYNKYNFKGTVAVGYRFQRIPYDKDQCIYHYNDSSNKYEAIVNTAKNTLKAEQLFATSSGDTLIIVTKLNTLFTYDGTSKTAKQIKTNVTSVKQNVPKSGNGINLAITFKDGTTKIYENVLEIGYNLTTKKDINVKSLAKYEEPKEEEEVKVTDGKYKDGTYTVGKDISTGIYSVILTGSSAKVIGNGTHHKTIMYSSETIHGKEYIEIESIYESIEISGAILEKVDMSKRNYKNTYTIGNYIVGKDIAPGIYKIVSGSVVKHTTFKMSETENLFTYSKSSVYIDVSDWKSVEVTGTLEKVDLSNPKYKNTFESGRYLVGYDIEPGKYNLEVTDAVEINGVKIGGIGVYTNVDATKGAKYYRQSAVIEIKSTDKMVEIAQGSKLTKVNENENPGIELPDDNWE